MNNVKQQKTATLTRKRTAFKVVLVLSHMSGWFSSYIRSISGLVDVVVSYFWHLLVDYSNTATVAVVGGESR